MRMLSSSGWSREALERFLAEDRSANHIATSTELALQLRDGRGRCLPFCGGDKSSINAQLAAYRLDVCLDSIWCRCPLLAPSTA